MRFLRFCRRKKAITEICDLIAPRDSPLVLIGFGDWSGGHRSPISRRCAGPLREIKTELRSRKNVMMKHIDEYLSSQVHNSTHLRLTNMRAVTTRWDKKTRKFVKTGVMKVHKVLHCKTSDGKLPGGCRETTCDRDRNASKNILMLLREELAGRDRPAAFRRPAYVPLIQTEANGILPTHQMMSYYLSPMLSGAPRYPTQRIHDKKKDI